ncbi:hypothetical protein COF68_05205 [Bacillus toyonensis]|uniref:hypothetical protein n=1 Tax=Bacillus toyonensis TaxID=155322 RepID=UPI000BFE4F91|nr:hypothetical protein [Bacillus toyonensis]PHE64242.1 hypothetical protein COF68_05205 [Bacillus toyonensis]
MNIQITMTNDTPEVKSNQLYQIVNEQGFIINQFKGEDIFEEWCKLTGVSTTIKNEVKDFSIHAVTYETDQFILEGLYANESEIPQGCVKCHCIQDNFVVECFVKVEGKTTYIFKPSPRLRMVKPLPNISVRNFIENNGFLAKAQ